MKKGAKQKTHRSFFDSVWHRLQRKISQDAGAQVTANQDHPWCIRTCEHTATPPDRTRNDLGHHVSAALCGKTKLVMVLARFCRIAPMELISFVPGTRWKRFFDGKRGINAATSSVCTATCFPDPANQLSATLANPNTSIATVVT